MQLPLDIRVATAGFVLGRLLLQVPPAALVHSLGDGAMRATWPLTDLHSARALALLADGVGELGAVRFDYERLFLRGAPPLVSLHSTAWNGAAPAAGRVAELRELYRRDKLSASGLAVNHDDHVGLQLLYVAERAADAGKAERDGDPGHARAARQAALRLREQHLDPVAGPLLAAIEEHAATRLFRALPDLVRGFLAEHARSCEAPDGDPAA